MKSISSHASLRTFAAIAAISTLTLAGVVPAAVAAAPAKDAGGTDWTARAMQTYTAFQDNLYLGAAGHGLYRENLDTAAGGNAYSYLWEYREATQAAVDLQKLPGAGAAYRQSAADRFSSLQQYYAVKADGRAGYESYLPAPLGTGGDVYYDDNAVVGLSLFDQYTATGNVSYLAKSKAAFDIVSRGWNTDTTLACPGGVDWIDRTDNTTRGANTTGLAAQLAAHLYEQTRQASYLEWSTRLFDWNNRCLEQSPGLYQNSRNDDGTIDPTLWTYNSGAMIATATLLYRATGDTGYLTQAEDAARGSLAYWTANGRLQQQPAIFNAFYSEDLMLLDSVSPDPSYRTAIETYAEATWTNNRDTATGLFHFQPSGGGDFDASRPAATLDQAAMVQIFATLGR